MKKIVYFLLCVTAMNAQVGINTPVPDPSAILDIYSNNKGLLIPRVILTNAFDGTSPIANPQMSTLVFNTNLNYPGGTGFYYWWGPSIGWIRLADDRTQLWQRNAVAGLTYLKTNTDRVGIGTPDPQERLEVAGKIRISDGSQANGRVLVSDADGSGTWMDNVAIKPAVTGVFGNGVTIGNGATVGNITANSNTGAYITLPPGKWMVFTTLLLQAYLPADGSMFIRTTFSCSPGVLSSCDIIAGGLLSGVISGPNHFGILNGQCVISNQAAYPKTYYLFANLTKYGNVPATTVLTGIGSSFWGENMMSAIPMN